METSGGTVQYDLVDLDLFNGPIDLLLYLVRRHELDPVQLQLARITRDFLDMLETIEWIHVDLAADFIVMASALIEIKSHEVLPGVEEESDPDDPFPAEASDDGTLISRLLEFKQLRDAAEALQEHAATWQERYPRLSDDRHRSSKDPSRDRIREVELWDLVSAFSRVVRLRQVEHESRIRYDEIPIGQHMQRIRELIDRDGEVKFSTLFDGEHRRPRIVGIFLAILELVRHHGFRAAQPRDYGEIWIRPPALTLHAADDEV